MRFFITYHQASLNRKVKQPKKMEIDFNLTQDYSRAQWEGIHAYRGNGQRRGRRLLWRQTRRRRTVLLSPAASI